ncbi:hypothetical protein PENTCL1PPCAC_5775, partial [Pristionchus entomophagus]
QVSMAFQAEWLPNVAGSGDCTTGPWPQTCILSYMPLISAPLPLDRETMRRYLMAPDQHECGLTIYHATVHQKSYANERRFFSPPPCVYMSGEGWKTKRMILNRMYAEARKSMIDSNNIKTDPNTERIHQKQACELCAYIGIGSDQEHQVLDFSDNKDYCPAKTLFISERDKRKYFELSVQLFYASTVDIGLFSSSRIKVISKPSKKKQSMKNSDCKFLCIASGTKVGLFNRLRTQSIATRYLHVSDGHFHASSSRWSAFTIDLCPDDDPRTLADGPNSTRYTAIDGFVHYGNVIKLVDSVAGISLPKLRIRKVDKGLVLLDKTTSEEPVSQLHKCALQMIDNELIYMSASHDKIIQQEAKLVPGEKPSDPPRHSITEGATWTIISTDTVEYRFYEGNGPVRSPISPAPLLKSIEVAGPMDRQRLELTGHGFTNRLKVWLHTVELDTAIRSEELAVASLPTIAQMMHACPEYGNSIGDAEFSISFVRDDGVIYGTDSTYTYKTSCLVQPNYYYQ